MRRTIGLVLISSFLFFANGCSNGTLPTQAIAITLVPNASSATLDAGSTAVSITASVANDPANAGVSWSVTPSTGCGTLTANGTTALYASPQSASLSAPTCTAIITATSLTDNTRASSVTFIVEAIAVQVSAGATTVSIGGSTNLSANVTYDSHSAGVVWTISNPTDGSCGSLDNVTATAATYLAPTIPPLCTATITATSQTDSTKSASVQIKVGGYQPLSFVTQQSNVASGEVGQVYAQSFQTQGGSGSYSWSIGGSLPPGVAVSATNPAEVVGTPTTAGSYTASVQVTDTVTGLSASSPTYSIHIGSGNDYTNSGLLYGPYTCYYQGFRDDGTAEAMLWDMKANGDDGSQGFVKSIYLDVNSDSGYFNGTATSGVAPYPGSYSVGSDMRGFLSFTVNGSTSNFAIAVGNFQLVQSQQLPKTLATEVRLTRIDDVGDGSSSYPASQQYGAGQCLRNDQSAISGQNPASAITGINWVFGLSGTNSSNQPEVAGGLFSTCGGTNTTCGGTANTGFVSNGVLDLVSGQTATPDTMFNATYSADSNTSNFYRYTMADVAGLPATNWVMYYVGTSQPSGVTAPFKAFLMSTDPIATSGLLVGQLRSQLESSYSSANLNSSVVVYAGGATVPATGTGVSSYYTNLMQATGDGAGNLTVNASTQNVGGQAGASSDGKSAVTFDATGNGRASFAGGYLYLFDNNAAVYLDAASNTSGRNVGLGWVEAQSVIVPSSASQYFTGSMFSFDPSLLLESGIQTLGGSGSVSLTQDSGGLGVASLDNVVAGLVTDWSSAGWPNPQYGSYQIDQGSNAGMYCAVVSANTSNATSPVGRVICVNAPGETVGVSSAGRPSISIQQQ